jgi:hypothetical protein
VLDGVNAETGMSYRNAPSTATPITDCDELQNMNSGDQYSLANNIDCTDYNWQPVTGDDTFALYGNGFMIKGLSFDHDSGVGALMYYLDGGAIYDLALSDVDISSPYGDIGGVVGQMWGGIISNVKVLSGSVSGDEFVGGIVGYLTGGTIEYAENHADISGADAVGGIVGYSVSDMTPVLKVANFGTITATDQYGSAGGIIGTNDGGYGVTDSYNTGSIVSQLGNTHGISGDIAFPDDCSSSTFGTVRTYNIGVGDYTSWSTPNGGIDGCVFDSYYNSDLLGQVDNPYGAIAATTAEMKTQSTYVGWDFDTVWQMPVVPNVISVTVDGVTVGFTVDNAGQITITAMPAHIAGTVPVVVTYSNGATVEVPYTYLAEEITPSVPFVPSEPNLTAPNTGYATAISSPGKTCLQVLPLASSML